MVSANLLQITTTPTVLDIKTTDGRIENPHAPPPLMEQSIEPGGFDINVKPQELRVDSYAARSSLGYGNYNNYDLIKKNADESVQDGYEDIRKIVQKGNQLLERMTPAEIAGQREKEKQHSEVVTRFLPSEKADVSFIDGEVNLNYKMTESNIKWNNLDIAGMDFVRGSVDISVAQKAYVDIKYLGTPTYFPADADPKLRLGVSI